MAAPDDVPPAPEPPDEPAHNPVGMDLDDDDDARYLQPDDLRLQWVQERRRRRGEP